MIKFTVGAVVYALTTLLATLLRAFVFVKLWAWFIMPFGLMSIGYAHALGISMTVAYLTYELNGSTDEKDPIHALIIGFFKSVFMSLLALAFGALYHSFM